MRGLVHIYTGDGKGKTTAAIGLGIRACGRGMKVLMVQFLKGAETGEMRTIKRLEPDFTLYRAQETKKFTWNMTEEEKKACAVVQQDIFRYAEKAVASGQVDLLILDEIMAAISTGMISQDRVISFVQSKPESLELVMTGRNAPAELVGMADYVTLMKAVKHPMEKGIPARKGIES